MKDKNVVWEDKFPEDSLKLSRLDMGLKLLATINDKGAPHITMISFSEAKTPDLIMWGQFTEGTSKKNVLNNPKEGFFFMNAEPPFIFARAKGEFQYKEVGGEDCDYFSRKPLLRYMTYMNVHTVYYNRVVGVTKVFNLSVLPIIKGALKAMLGFRGKKMKYEGKIEKKLNKTGMKIFNGLMTAKFIAYIDPKDGFPVILPCFQIRSPDGSRLTFPIVDFKEEFMKFKKGDMLAVYGIIPGTPVAPELVNLHITGKFLGYEKVMGMTFGQIDIEEIYNSMPPTAGVIYPKLQVRPKVEDFHL